jgi:formiminotetrahydrofolate cyclodeaminase
VREPAREQQPLAAGPAAATAIALAAGLAELTARLAGQDELVGRARRFRADAETLGRRDAEAYARRLRERSSEAREYTIEVPLRMAALAADVGELAAEAAAQSKPDSRFDAVAGTILAEAAARTAAMLVEANLGGRDDERVPRARVAVERAASAARGARAPSRDG